MHRKELSDLEMMGVDMFFQCPFLGRAQKRY